MLTENQSSSHGTIEEAGWLLPPDPGLYMQRWWGPRLCWSAKAEGAPLSTRHTSRSRHCPRQTEACAALPWARLEKPFSESNSKSSRTQPMLHPDITRHTCVCPLRTGGSTRSHIKSLYQVQDSGWRSAQNQKEKVRTRKEAQDQWIPPHLHPPPWKKLFSSTDQGGCSYPLELIRLVILWFWEIFETFF